VTKSAETPDGYLPLRADGLIPDTVLPFDIFIYMPIQKKTLKFRNQGSEILAAEVARLKEKGVTHVYVRAEDRERYEAYVAQQISEQVSHEHPGSAQRDRLKDATRGLFKAILEDDDISPKEATERCGTVVRKIVDEVVPENQSKAYHKLVEFIDQSGADDLDHGLNVSTYAVIFAVGAGYANRAAVEHCAMGGIFHDLGLSMINPELVTRYRAGEELFGADLDEIHSHPHYSVQVLQSKLGGTSNEVRFIIEQHHENFDGTGFPVGLRGPKIFNLAKIVSIANAFDHVMNANPDFSPAEAIMQLSESQAGPLDQKRFDPTLLEKIYEMML
jgi:HD-GYP domain-containing protein (c-di-GMP phosphodiesterase class II)